MKKEKVIEAIKNYLENVGIDTSEDFMSKVQSSDCSTPKIVYKNTEIDKLVDLKVEEIISFILSQF